MGWNCGTQNNRQSLELRIVEESMDEEMEKRKQKKEVFGQRGASGNRARIERNSPFGRLGMTEVTCRPNPSLPHVASSRFTSAHHPPHHTGLAASYQQIPFSMADKDNTDELGSEAYQEVRIRYRKSMDMTLN